MTLEDIYNKLHKLEQLILKQNYKPFNLVEAAEYLSRSQSDIYKLTRQRKIPCHKPTGKYLYFFRDELDEWVKTSPANGASRNQEAGDPDGIPKSGQVNKTEAFHRVKNDPAPLEEQLRQDKDPASPQNPKTNQGGVNSDEELCRDEEEDEPP